jgi:hypothetical protein
VICSVPPLLEDVPGLAVQLKAVVPQPDVKVMPDAPAAVTVSGFVPVSVNAMGAIALFVLTV